MHDLKSLDNFGDLSDEDIEILLDIEDEFHRRGHFEKLFPLKDNIDIYAGFFQSLRYNNLLLWKHIKSNYNFLETFYTKISNSNV